MGSNNIYAHDVRVANRRDKLSRNSKAFQTLRLMRRGEAKLIYLNPQVNAIQELGPERHTNPQAFVSGAAAAPTAA